MASEIDRIDEELRMLQARREGALAKAKRAEDRKDQEAAKILVGSTPKKGEPCIRSRAADGSCREGQPSTVGTDKQRR